LARQAVTGKRALPPAIPSLADSVEREPEAIAAALGQLWCLGAAVDWAGYRGHERRRRLALPVYPFQRQRHWVDAPPALAAPVAVPAPLAAVPPLLAAVPALLAAASPPLVAVPPPSLEMPIAMATPAPVAPSADRRRRMLASVCELVEEVS